MKFFDPKDNRYPISTRLAVANELVELKILSEGNFVHFLNTGKLGIYDSIRLYIKSIFKRLT